MDLDKDYTNLWSCTNKMLAGCQFNKERIFFPAFHCDPSQKKIYLFPNKNQSDQFIQLTYNYCQYRR